MYRSLSPKQLSPYLDYGHDRRDTLIKELTREINGLQSLDHDFLALNDDLAVLQSRYAMLLEEKEREEKEYQQFSSYSRTSSHTKRLHLEELENEANSFAIKLENILIETEETSREKERFLDRLRTLQGEVEILRREITQASAVNCLTKEKVECLGKKLKQSKEERSILENTCDGYSSELTILTEDVRQLEKDLRLVGASITTHQHVQGESQQIKAKCEAWQRNKRDQQLKAQTDNQNLALLKEEQGRIGAGLKQEKFQMEKAEANTKEQLDSLCGCNKESLLKLKSTENSTLNTSLSVEEETKNYNHLRARNTGLLNHNRQLNTEIDRLMKDMREKERKNLELLKLLKDSLECDLKAQNILVPRREHLQRLIEINENTRPKGISVIR